MKRVSIQDAKTHLSQLLEAVRLGEEVVIAKSGRGIARLVPMRDASRLGGRDDLIDLSDDFDASLPGAGPQSKR
jgi:prevent-host-death family protein